MATNVYIAYTSDDGTVYQARTRDYIATAIGATPEALGAHPRLPSNVQARYVLGQDPATGREHRLRFVSTSSNLWTGAGGASTVTVAFPGSAGSGLALNIAGRVGGETVPTLIPGIAPTYFVSQTTRARPVAGPGCARVHRLQGCDASL